MNNRSVSTCLGRLCLAALSAVAGAGIAGCNVDSAGKPMPMYGISPETIMAGGHVKQASGEAITGIQVTAQLASSSETKTTTSDSHGIYYFTMHGAKQSDGLTVVATDVDGPAHGGDFETVTKTITHEEIGDDHTVEVIITMIPKP